MEPDVDMGYSVRCSFISTTMHFSTNSYGNVRRPSTGPAGNRFGEGPEPSIVEKRRGLFADRDMLIPPRGEPRTEALYKFIDGEPLSRRDSLGLSQWLEARNLQDAKLLFDMQGLKPSFVPMLNLMRTGRDPQALIDLLMDAHDRGLRFGVSVTEGLRKRIAHVLYAVMASPQSRVTSIDYPCEAISEEGPGLAIRELLRSGITACTTLEWVSGRPPVLLLLERSVPEIELTAFFSPPAQVARRLPHVLSLGDVEKLSLKSDVGDAHLWVARAVASANEKLPPQRGVRQVELTTFARDSNYNRRQDVVTLLFAAMHLRDLTLPDPAWVQIGSPTEPKQLAHYYRVGGWKNPLKLVQWLQTLTFQRELRENDSSVEVDIINDTIELLGPILQRSKEGEYMSTCGAGKVFTKTMTSQLFGKLKEELLKSHAGVPIDPLTEWLGNTFAGTSTGQALAVLNTAAAAAAKEGRDDAEQKYK